MEGWQLMFEATKNVLVLFVLLLDLNPVLCGRSHHSHSDHSIDIDKGLHDPKLASKGHISEHLEDQVQLNVSEMSTEELEFYYFRLHDLNNDTKLDGLEIFKALKHSAEREMDGKSGKSHSDQKQMLYDDEYISKIIDHLLVTEDLNNDGYITWLEFAAGRTRAKEGSDD